MVCTRAHKRRQCCCSCSCGTTLSALRPRQRHLRTLQGSLGIALDARSQPSRFKARPSIRQEEKKKKKTSGKRAVHLTEGGSPSALRANCITRARGRFFKDIVCPAGERDITLPSPVRTIIAHASVGSLRSLRSASFQCSFPGFHQCCALTISHGGTNASAFSPLPARVPVSLSATFIQLCSLGGSGCLGVRRTTRVPRTSPACRRCGRAQTWPTSSRPQRRPRHSRPTAPSSWWVVARRASEEGAFELQAPRGGGGDFLELDVGPAR